MNGDTAADERELVREILLGSNAAFERLVARYSKLAAATIARSVNTREDVVDLTQECFLQVYRYLHTFRFKASLGTWIVQVAQSTAAKHVRKRHPSLTDDGEVQALLDRISVSPGADETLSAQQLRDRLARAIARLGPAERIVVKLHYLDEMSISEIKAMTGLPEGTIKSHLSRARDKLRVWLSQ